MSAVPELWAVPYVQLLRVGGDTLVWHMHVANELGELRLSVIPAETFECRVAEYDLDAADFDAILDLVLHERLLRSDPATDVEVVASSAADTGHQSGMRAAKVPWEKTSPATARQVVPSAIAQVKQSVQIVPAAVQADALATRSGRKIESGSVTSLLASPVTGDPLDLVRQYTQLDRELIEQKRQEVWGRRAPATAAAVPEGGQR